MKKQILLIACVSFLFSIGNAQESKFSFKENYKVSSHLELTVSTHGGYVNVFPSENSEIEVFYIIKKNNKIISINKDDIKKEGISLKVEQDINSLDIKVKYPKGYLKLSLSDQISVNFEIHIPKDTDCDIITDNGITTKRNIFGVQLINTL